MVLPCSSIYKDINSEIEFPTLKSKAVEVYLDPMGKVLDNTTRNLYNRDDGNIENSFKMASIYRFIYLF
jgi:hypothetical protein